MIDESRAALRLVRTPPVEAVFALHAPQEKGKCRWCGDPVFDNDGKLRRASWHQDCLGDFRIISWPGTARECVWERDQGRCSECDKDGSIPIGFRPAYPGSVERGDRVEWTRAPDLRDWGRSCTLQPIPGWHVDHRVPLWKVAHMEAIARLDYFRLPNLVTLCHECHRHKTKKEAAERAHHNALAKRHDGTERPKRKTKWPSRKIQSRGFPKAQERK